MNICKYCGQEPYFIETPDGKFCATCDCVVFASEGKTKEEAAAKYIRKRNRTAIICNLIVYSTLALIMTGLASAIVAFWLFIAHCFRTETPSAELPPLEEIQAAEENLFKESTKLYPNTPQFPEGTQTNEP